MAAAFAMSTPLPVLYSDLNNQTKGVTEQPRSRSRLRSSFGRSNDDSPSSTESSRLRSSLARKKSAGSSSGGTSTRSLRTSLECNGSSSKPADGRLAKMLASKGHTSSAVRRRSTRSITSLPVTSKEEEKAVKDVKAKKNAQEMAKNQLAQQQKQAMKRQAEKGKTLDDFFSKDKLDDDDSIDSDDDDMFSFLQWSATGSEKSRRQSVGRARRSMSAPRIRLSSRSVTSLLSESQEKSRETCRSTSVPKTREDLEASMGMLQTQTLSSLYGIDQRTSSRRIKKRGQDNRPVSSNGILCRKEEAKDSLVTAPDKPSVGVSQKSKEGSSRSSSRLRSVKQLRQEEERRHKGGRRDSDNRHRHKSSRKSLKDSDEKSSSRKERERGRRDHRKSSEDAEEGRRRGKSRGRVKDGDENRRGKNRRRVKEGEDSKHRSKSKKRLSKEDIQSSGDSRRAKSRDGQRRRHRSKNRRRSGDERKSSHRSKSLRRGSADSDTLTNSTENSPHSRGSRSSVRSSTSTRPTEEKEQGLSRSCSLRRRSDSAALLREASQLLLVDEEVDHHQRAVSLSDCEDSSSDLRARKSYFSKRQTSQGAPFQYPESSPQSKQEDTVELPVHSLRSQPSLQRSSFASIRGMINNLNLDDET